MRGTVIHARAAVSARLVIRRDAASPMVSPPDSAIAMEPRLRARVLMACGRIYPMGFSVVEVTAATPTTHPSRHKATGAAKDFSSIESRDCTVIMAERLPVR